MKDSKRKLAAIVFTDIAGFMKLSAKNEPIRDFTVAFRIFKLFDLIGNQGLADKYLQQCYD